MKILHIYELGPLGEEKVFGGIEVAMLELCRQLAKKHEVGILTGAGKNGGGREYYIDGVKIIPADLAGIMRATWSPTNLKLIRQATFPLALLKLHNKLDYDVYHGHVYTSGIIANYLARRNGAAAVNTIHGSYYPVWNFLENPIKASFFKSAERFLAPLLARLSNLQIHTGSYFAERVLEWGAPRNKVKVIYNGVDLETFCPKARATNPVPIIFTARRLVKKNGVEYLIKALAIVLKRMECELYIAGDGPEKPKLEALTRNLGAAEHVKFLGLVKHSEIPSQIAHADVVAIPSIIEATSLFMLEAMACGKPVIATKNGAMAEVINSDNGVLVEPANELVLAERILRLLESEETRSRIGRKARITAKMLSWAKAARRTEKEYKRCINEGSAGVFQQEIRRERCKESL